MKTSKSPKAIAFVAYVTAKRALPLYRHKFSPKKFTQPQLLACLVLKEFFKTDYRGIEALLQDSEDLRRVLELYGVPHFTTLHKAAQRLTATKPMRKLFASIIALAIQTKVMRPTVSLAVLDSTGFTMGTRSEYYVRRKAKGGATMQETHYRRFPKVGIVADTKSYITLVGIPSWGPSPDILHLKSSLDAATTRVPIRILVADAGYDSEEAHRYARTRLGMRTIIPARIGRPTDKPPTGTYRRLMTNHFNKKLYGQRWQGETLNSMIKRTLGSFIHAKTYWNQMREIMLRLLTHNVKIVLPY